MKICGFVLLAVLLSIVGCGESSPRKAVKNAVNKAGKMVGEGTSTFFSGIGEGIDKASVDYDIRVNPILIEKGVSITLVKKTNGEKGKHFLSFYILSKEAVSGVLRVKMFNAKNAEIGRSETKTDLEEDGGKYVDFELDEKIPLALVQYIELDKKNPKKENETK